MYMYYGITEILISLYHEGINNKSSSSSTSVSEQVQMVSTNGHDATSMFLCVMVLI